MESSQEYEWVEGGGGLRDPSQKLIGPQSVPSLSRFKTYHWLIMRLASLYELWPHLQ